MWDSEAAQASLTDVLVEIEGSEADCVQDSHVGQLSACAERVDGRAANAEDPRDRGNVQQLRCLDPSWTRRFVFLRWGMGDSWIGAVIPSRVKAKGWTLEGASLRFVNAGDQNCQGEGRRFEPGVPLQSGLESAQLP